MIAMIFLVSCDENENLTFDNENGQTLNYFTENSSNLQIPIGVGNSGTIDIVFGVTTVSTSDRTITFSVDADNTDAPTSMYSLSSFIATIPANEYQATVQMTGNYDVLLESDYKTVTLKIDNASNGFFDETKNMVVKLAKYCPIPDDYFVGMYLLEQTSPFVDGPTLSDGTVVEVTTLGNGSTQRTFSTANYPNYCSTTMMDFSFNLVCNEIIVNVMDTTCRCSSADDWFGPATTHTVYDLSSDLEMYITFTDDAQSDCGAPTQTTYKLIKQ